MTPRSIPDRRTRHFVRAAVSSGTKRTQQTCPAISRGRIGLCGHHRVLAQEEQGICPAPADASAVSKGFGKGNPAPPKTVELPVADHRTDGGTHGQEICPQTSGAMRLSTCHQPSEQALQNAMEWLWVGKVRNKATTCSQALPASSTQTRLLFALRSGL